MNNFFLLNRFILILNLKSYLTSIANAPWCKQEKFRPQTSKLYCQQCKCDPIFDQFLYVLHKYLMF